LFGQPNERLPDLADKMTYVLVAGAGLGGWIWGDVRQLLEAQKDIVFSPTLTGVGERVHLLNSSVDLHTHVEDICQVLFYEDLQDVVLVGHSYAGVVITGVADRLADRISKLVYLDAPLGLSHLDIFPGAANPTQFPHQTFNGVEVIAVPDSSLLAFYGITEPKLAAWTLARMTPHPWKASEQRLRLQNPARVAALPRYHIVSGRTVEMGAHDRLALEERVKGRYFELDGPHALMVTNAAELARVLLQIEQQS
jgi:pimeloyl-ACP methyl ester carboxylesterase